MFFFKNIVWEATVRVYHTLERVFYPIYKQLEVGLKILAAPRFFKPLLGFLEIC